MSDAKLHLGCGLVVHPDWENYDLVPRDPRVVAHDFTKGLPHDDASCAAVYHSHVLEHLRPPDAVVLTRACFRVLAPGGVLRVVVPDLERLCRTYLAQVDRAKAGEPGAEADHAWSVIHFVDQMVREESGGQMGAYFVDGEPANLAFVREHMGPAADTQIGYATGEIPPPKGPAEPTPPRAERRRLRKLAKLLTPEEQAALLRQRFRESGEIHRWMYDAVSLRTHLEEAGFADITVRTAAESAIPDFADFAFEHTVDGDERKPQSLYMEARKPRPEKPQP